VTELAYLADLPSAYVARFTARVTALPPGGLVLDRTYFYPTGGGQPCDRGTVEAGASRLDVVEVTKSGASVIHRLRGGADRPPVGAAVEGTLDWDRRHQHMRLHTLQHLVSARVFTRTGLRTRRANLLGTGATIDLEAPLPAGAVEGISEDVAETGRSPREVRIRHVPRVEWDANPAAPRSGLVPLPPQVDPVRVIEIDGEDACPCGGTHLRSTAEIGEVVFAPLGAGGTRLAFTLRVGGATRPPG
jgi:misacylated tRNA(Ala) deacylase